MAPTDSGHGVAPNPSAHEDDLATALEIAELAAACALELFDRGVETRLKHDGSPVTDADLAVERLLVDELAHRRPHDGILSEEGATRPGQRRWILDPIDGTSDFVQGGSDWGTHVALEDEEGRLTVGVITRPAQGGRCWATRGGGAYRDEPASGAPAVALRTSTVATLAACRATVWPPDPGELRTALERAGCWVDPGQAGLWLFLAGELDLVIVRGGDVWDHAPAVLLTSEAGGRFHDPSGGTRLDLQGGIYTNGVIDHELANLPAW